MEHIARHRNGKIAFQEPVAVIIHDRYGLSTVEPKTLQHIGQPPDPFVEDVIIVTYEVPVDYLPLRFQRQGIGQQAFDQQGEIRTGGCRRQFFYVHIAAHCSVGSNKIMCLSENSREKRNRPMDD